MFENLYFNFFSIGWLIAAVFYLAAGLFCLIIPNRSKATFHLGITSLTSFIAALAYSLSASFYSPALTIHRYFTITFIAGSAIHLTQVLFLLPGDTHPKTRKVFLYSMWSIIIAALGIFMIKSFSAGHVYKFAGHYWDYALDDISKYIGILIMLFALIGIIIGTWRFIIIKSRERWTILFITIAYLIITVIPGLANILSRDGAMGREIFMLVFDFLSVLGFFIILVIFINSTSDRTSFMAKIVGISLVTILLLLLGLSYQTMQVSERAYDGIHRAQVPRILTDKSFRPGDHDYIVGYHEGTDLFTGIEMPQHVTADLNSLKIDQFKPLKYEFKNRIIWQQIKNIEGNDFKKLAAILKNAHPFFAGYKNIIEHVIKIKNINGESLNKKILAYLKKNERTIAYQRNKIIKMSDETFRADIQKFLNKSPGSFKHFKNAIEDHLKLSSSDGNLLKSEVINFLTPMQSPLRRSYREDRKTNQHYLAFQKVDLVDGYVYEVGFSYRAYRRYIHPDSMNLVISLGIILIVVVIGYQFFFLGALINPVKALVQGVQEVEHDNLDIVVPVKVRDEIGYLTHNFNNMVVQIKTARNRIKDYTENLEQKVKERTEELNKAMDSLWGEMQLAKKIQTVLLPIKPAIDGFEIAAHLAPADEVGGDYYDIINVAGRDWIIIGDVSGHGVPAGLIMMMAQTSIHTALSQNPDLPPRELLIHINKTISRNIKQLDETKYMTINVLAGYEDGKFAFSGLHQDIMLYRAQKNVCEIVETSGMWIGIVDDIDGMVNDEHLTMEIGDVMLIYTDGITEAWIDDVNASHTRSNNMYGDEMLMKTFCSLGEQSPNDIRQGILKSLEGYTCDDDVTMVIIKRIS